jgi:hypothetical protein
VRVRQRRLITRCHRVATLHLSEVGSVEGLFHLLWQAAEPEWSANHLVVALIPARKCLEPDVRHVGDAVGFIKLACSSCCARPQRSPFCRKKALRYARRHICALCRRKNSPGETIREELDAVQALAAADRLEACYSCLSSGSALGHGETLVCMMGLAGSGLESLQRMFCGSAAASPLFAGGRAGMLSYVVLDSGPAACVALAGVAL